MKIKYLRNIRVLVNWKYFLKRSLKHKTKCIQFLWGSSSFERNFSPSKAKFWERSWLRNTTVLFLHSHLKHTWFDSALNKLMYQFSDKAFFVDLTFYVLQSLFASGDSGAFGCQTVAEINVPSAKSQFPSSGTEGR